MATKKPKAVDGGEPSDTAEAFVLLDCAFGKAGEVVTLPTAEAEAGQAAGMLDLHPDAIAAHAP